MTACYPGRTQAPLFIPKRRQTSTEVGIYSHLAAFEIESDRMFLMPHKILSTTINHNVDTPKPHKLNLILNPSQIKQLKMCTSTSTGLVNRNGPGSAASSTISDIVKGTSTTGKTKCLECDGYECCCIPIPCTVM
ncbi:uncharacterized protein EAF01_010596 [Botrytis porri]|nr:uncharacterized protein EAF01_010596 [Botrytis porri]KAF7890787.1 hypothetical protein EAF01_010596 [Botrytis porri]